MEEKRNESIQEVADVQEEAYKSGSMQYIDSREVAEIVGKNHKDLMRDIRRYCKQMEELNQRNLGSSGFNQRNFAPSEFFMESIYVDGKGEERPCYLVTKKGCEFIAHKLTGIKGTKFTATYINRFHEMEGVLESRDSEKLYDIQQMIEEHEQIMQEQMRFNHLLVDRINDLASQLNWKRREDSILVPVSEENEAARRRRNLNQLIRRMADACGWEKTFALHRLYQTIEDVLDISLDDYLEIYRKETMNDYASTLEVVLEHDRLYKTAVKLCSNTISKMKCL